MGGVTWAKVFEQGLGKLRNKSEPFFENKLTSKILFTEPRLGSNAGCLQKHTHTYYASRCKSIHTRYTWYMEMRSKLT